MSFRDQKGRTRPLDRVKEDVSLEYITLSQRITDKNGSEWLETVAMTPQGIQSYLEEKEIVCLVWSLDAVEGRSPDTILLVQPNGMVETVGSIPSCISQTQTNYYGILRRSFNVDCTDCNVHVWLSYIDCGCIESATSLRCDSNPVTQTNLGLTSLYSLFSYLDGSHQWIDYPLVWFLHMERPLVGGCIYGACW